MAGKKTFVAGEVLTAQDVNDYLMDQSVMNFASSAARSSAIPTPTEGMTTYVQDRNQIETFDGAEYRGMSGLQLVKKQTIGSAVASVAVTDAFSATYENYQIVVSGGASSAQNLMFFTLTGGTSAYDYTLLDILYSSVAFRGDRAQNASSFPYAGSGNSTNGLNMVLDVQQPFLTKFTYMGSTINTDSAAGRGQARHKAATSYTGFTLTANTGTFTGGTIYVYGYGT